jgi:hypothetical protein
MNEPEVRAAGARAAGGAARVGSCCGGATWRYRASECRPAVWTVHGCLGPADYALLGDARSRPAACGGTHGDAAMTPSADSYDCLPSHRPRQVCVSTTNRNFPGRMGHKEGQVRTHRARAAAAAPRTQRVPCALRAGRGAAAGGLVLNSCCRAHTLQIPLLPTTDSSAAMLAVAAPPRSTWRLPSPPQPARSQAGCATPATTCSEGRGALLRRAACARVCAVCEGTGIFCGRWGARV